MYNVDPATKYIGTIVKRSSAKEMGMKQRASLIHGRYQILIFRHLPYGIDAILLLIMCNSRLLVF